MPRKYTKSVTNDLNGNFNQNQLHDEIKNSSSFSTPFYGINITDDVMDIIFESDLSTNEENELNALISNHTVTSQQIGSKVVTYSLHYVEVTSASYTKILAFMYPGSKAFNITNVEILSNLDSGNSYDIRVRDVTNNKDIALLSNLNNSSSNAFDMGTINNLPENKSIFEIQSRVSGNNNRKVNFDSLIIYYY